MATQNSAQQMNQLPKLNANPLSWWHWWITPRSESREDKFYERNIRAISCILFLIIFFGGVILAQGAIADFQTLLAIAFLTLIVPIVAVYRGHLLIAGWALSAVLIYTGISIMFMNGYWAPNTVGFMMAIPVLTALLVRSNRVKLLVVVVIVVLYTGVAFYQQSTGQVSIFDSSFAFSNPGGAGVRFIMLMMLLAGGGGYLLVEFRSQQTELKELVQTLEQRVEERTYDLQVAKQQAEQAQADAEKANQVKSHFLANMSHELRTPLNAILNFTAFVADGVMGPVNDAQVDLLNQSISSGKHLLALINDVLDITKIEAGLMDLFIQEVDMNEVLGSAASVGKGLVKDKNVAFNAIIDENLPTSYGDKRRLRQVFLNMISNAIKFTHEGQVTLRATKIDNGIRIEVEDTGIGIAEKDQHLVFESFKQAKHDFTETIGTGLGMPISKYFVESHQGKMWFESVANQGSTFYVELPILSEEKANQITLEMPVQAQVG